MTAVHLRLPDSLHAALKETARREGISLNQFLVSAAGEKLTAWDTASYLQERAQAAPDASEYARILDAAPDRAPLAGDEIVSLSPERA